MIGMLHEGTTDLPVLGGESNFILIDVAGWENQLPPPFKPRALWSHLRFRNLPRGVEKKKVKVVFITRNLKDVFVSQYNFLKNFYAPIGISKFPVYSISSFKMSQFEHVKDKYGNDIYYGHPEVKFTAVSYVKDFYKQVEMLKEIELRPDDVITVSYPKSGQNWTNQMVRMLLEGTTDLPDVGRENDFVWMDTTGWEKQLLPPVKPRAIWSHLRFRNLPRDVEKKKVKLILITRNLKDVFVSQYNFLHNFHGPMGYEGTWPQFFEWMLENGYWYGNPFDYLRDWEREIEAHPDIPILQVAYEDMKEDPVRGVEKINEFLGTQRSKEFCREVADHCDFSNIHKSRKFDASTLEHSKWKTDIVPQKIFYRKGQIGDWKNWFTVAQNEQFEEAYRTKMAGSKFKFRYE
nr:hypothetical protein BaRGS_020131 [Batillaria attramentaria]